MDQRWIVPLIKPEFYIGRAFNAKEFKNDLILLNEGISRKQAKIILDKNQVIIQNLSERVPISVENKKISFEEKTELKDGDHISIANYTLTYISNQAFENKIDTCTRPNKWNFFRGLLRFFKFRKRL